MGFRRLNHFDDPPQLSRQVVLPALKRIMCLRLSRTRGSYHTHTHCVSDTGWMEGDSLGSSLGDGGDGGEGGGGGGVTSVTE